MADTEPKINLPVIRNGKVVTPIISTSSTTVAPVSEPKINYPKLDDGGKSQLKQWMADEQGADAARLRGLTLGLSDRVQAALTPGSYKENLAKQFQQRDAYAAAHPYSNIGNELLGGIASGGAVSGGLKAGAAALLPKIAEWTHLPGIAPAMARLGLHVGENAGYGELSSQAQKDYGHVGDEVGKGAAYGAAAGAATGALTKVAKMAAGPVGRFLNNAAMSAGIINPVDVATRKFMGSLKAADVTPDDISTALKYLRGDDIQPQGPLQPGKFGSPGTSLPDLRPPVIVADALPQTALNVARKNISSSEKAAGIVSEKMQNRNTGQVDRMRNVVRTTISPDTDSTSVRDQILAQRAEKAGPHYEKAYQADIEGNPSVQDWLGEMPANGRLIANKAKNLAEYGTPMKGEVETDPATGKQVWKTYPTVEDLDTVKKHLDQKIGALWDPIKGAFKYSQDEGAPSAFQLMKQRDSLVNLIDSLTPDGNGGSHYANARASFADDTDLLNAHMDGQKVMRTRPEDVDKVFDKYDGRPELQDAYRSGVSSALNDILDKSNVDGSAANVRRVWGTFGMQKKLNSIMANPSTDDQVARSLNTEKAMFDTSRNLAPGSGGSDSLADAEGFQLPIGVANAAMGRFGAAAANLGRFGMGAIKDIRPEVGDELGRIATMSPEEFAAWSAAQKAQAATFGSQAWRGAGALSRYLANSVAPTTANVAGLVSADDNFSAPPQQ